MPKIATLILLVTLATAGPAVPRARAQQKSLTFQDIQRLPTVPADRRVYYGGDPLQFGELRLPENVGGRRPVAIIIHGGCWYSEYKVDHVAAFAEALTDLGFATWAIEYRRVGDAGGGWPGTFDDVARGADLLRLLAREHRLDLGRVVVIGHSAGGELALWLAARSASAAKPGVGGVHSLSPLRLRGVVSLAGITDMRKFGPRCDDAAAKFLGGSPAEVPDRYDQTSPIELLPARLPQRLIHGAADKIVPVEMGREYEAAARRKGGDVRLTVIEGAGHFELIAPRSAAWPAITAALLSLARGGPARRPSRLGAARRKSVVGRENVVGGNKR